MLGEAAAAGGPGVRPEGRRHRRHRHPLRRQARPRASRRSSSRRAGPTRVRNVQTHNRDVESAAPGSRVALNLPDLAAGAGHAGPGRGHRGGGGAGRRRYAPALGGPCDTWDVLLERSGRSFDGAPAPRRRRTARPSTSTTAAATSPPGVHLLDAEGTIARRPTALAQVRFESPVFAFAGDRFVVRDWSARHTLAGGLVLDPDATPAGLPHRRPPGVPAGAGGRAGQWPRPSSPRKSRATAWRGRDRARALLLKSRFSADEVAAAAAALAAAGKAGRRRRPADRPGPLAGAAPQGGGRPWTRGTSSTRSSQV